jgi:hypothetical protein
VLAAVERALTERHSPRRVAQRHQATGTVLKDTDTVAVLDRVAQRISWGQPFVALGIGQFAGARRCATAWLRDPAFRPF